MVNGSARLVVEALVETDEGVGGGGLDKKVAETVAVDLLQYCAAIELKRSFLRRTVRLSESAGKLTYPNWTMDSFLRLLIAVIFAIGRAPGCDSCKR